MRREDGFLSVTALARYHAGSLLAIASTGHRPAFPFACCSLRPDAKIAELLEDTSAEYFAFSLAELWGLPLGKESLETVTSQVQFQLSRGGYYDRGWTKFG
jgi:hypothetical protein